VACGVYVPGVKATRIAPLSCVALSLLSRCPLVVDVATVLPSSFEVVQGGGSNQMGNHLRSHSPCLHIWLGGEQGSEGGDLPEVG